MREAAGERIFRATIARGRKADGVKGRGGGVGFGPDPRWSIEPHVRALISRYISGFIFSVSALSPALEIFKRARRTLRFSPL